MKNSYPQEFEELWAIYPKRSGGNPKILAYKQFSARLNAGYSYEDMLEGLKRYKAYCEATDRVKTEFTMQGKTFFGIGEWFLEDWELPAQESKLSLPRDDNELWPWAKEHGFSDPGQQTFSQYRRTLQAEIERRKEKDNG